MPTVTEQLRLAVETSGQSRYAIAKATGINASVLSRFVASGRGLRSANIDLLCEYLGLTLTASAPNTPAPAKSTKPARRTLPAPKRKGR